MNARKEKIGAPARPPTSAKGGEIERFVLWARDGGRVAEIEMPEFRPRVEVVLWQGRTFVWHDKTRRYVERVCFKVQQAKAPPRKRRSPDGDSFQFELDDS